MTSAEDGAGNDARMGRRAADVDARRNRLRLLTLMDWLLVVVLIISSLLCLCANSGVVERADRDDDVDGTKPWTDATRGAIARTRAEATAATGSDFGIMVKADYVPSAS